MKFTKAMDLKIGQRINFGIRERCFAEIKSIEVQNNELLLRSDSAFMRVNESKTIQYLELN